MAKPSKYEYHHIGIPTTEMKEGEVYHEHLKLFSAGYDTSEFGIQWHRFPPDAPYPDLVKTVPHVAFKVNDLDEALKGKKVIWGPQESQPGLRAAMIEENGAPIEFIETDLSQEELASFFKGKIRHMNQFAHMKVSFYFDVKKNQARLPIC